MRRKQNRILNLDVLAETIIRLDEEWERYCKNGGRDCPKCKAGILGKIQAYDNERHVQYILQCLMCGLIIPINGGAHLRKAGVVGGLKRLESLENKLEEIRRPPRSRSRRRHPHPRKSFFTFFFVSCT